MHQVAAEEQVEEVTEMVCLEAELSDGQMKEVTVADRKVLLVCTGGQYSAVGSQCSHYNAPLVKGVLVGERVRCPFHGACFNVRTGDIEDYPGLDCLPAFKVKVEDGRVYVTVNKSSLKLTRRVKDMCTRVPDNKNTIVLVGGGPAALVCAETLRQNSYEGRIIMVTKDNLPPLDKPKLSKALNVDSSSILLRSDDFYQRHGIEVWTRKEVVSVNVTDKTVELLDGSVLPYTQLLISTGCRARPLSCPGWDLDGVKLLQSHHDASEIHAASQGRRVVVVGASFIGMEVASYLSDKAASVTVVGTASYPYERSLGPEIGKMCMQMLEEQQVKFHMNCSVSEIQGDSGKAAGCTAPAKVALRHEQVRCKSMREYATRAVMAEDGTTDKEGDTNAFVGWKFKEHFDYKPGQEGRNISVQCKLCIPSTKLLSFPRDSTSDLRKLLEREHPKAMQRTAAKRTPDDSGIFKCTCQETF